MAFGKMGDGGNGWRLLEPVQWLHLIWAARFLRFVMRFGGQQYLCGGEL